MAACSSHFTFHSTVHHLYSLSNSTILGQKAPVSVVGRGSDHGMQILINDVWDSFTQPIRVIMEHGLSTVSTAAHTLVHNLDDRAVLPLALIRKRGGKGGHCQSRLWGSCRGSASPCTWHAASTCLHGSWHHPAWGRLHTPEDGHLIPSGIFAVLNKLRVQNPSSDRNVMDELRQALLELLIQLERQRSVTSGRISSSLELPLNVTDDAMELCETAVLHVPCATASTAGTRPRPESP